MSSPKVLTPEDVAAIRPLKAFPRLDVWRDEPSASSEWVYRAEAVEELQKSHEALRREVARLTEDRERIEWLERELARVLAKAGERFSLTVLPAQNAVLVLTTLQELGKPTVREALDAARREDAATRTGEE